MRDETSQEWGPLRRLQRRLTLAGLAVVTVQFFAFLSTLAPRNISRPLVFALLIVLIWLLIRLLKVYSEFTYWLCPKCGQPFHYMVGWLGRANNPFARRCVHCGLPNWSTILDSRRIDQPRIAVPGRLLPTWFGRPAIGSLLPRCDLSPNV
jgi:hypothetical protein